MAVCGVPDPNKDHTVVMARFAKDCLRTFQALVLELESTLGPDTGMSNCMGIDSTCSSFDCTHIFDIYLFLILSADLGLRAGLHSGPVTGGVLRGDRARFQLFGDS